MSNSMIATIYLIALIVFFLLLVVLTITLIAGKSRRDEEDDTDGEKDIFAKADAELADNELWEGGHINTFDETVGNNGDADISDETYVNTYDEETQEEHGDDSVADMRGSSAEADAWNVAASETEAVTEVKSEAAIETEAVTEVKSEDASETEAVTEAGSEDASETEAVTEVGSEAEVKNEEMETDAKEVAGAQPQTEDVQLVDSAFAPEPMDIRLTNEELDESVREAVAMGAAASGLTGFSAADMFGVQEELDKSRRKTRGRSSVPSTDDFFWYNRLDVAEKPSYKPAEMYYHYFDTAKDCIEDLLIEMYDCALVRTEEIRYIAYGIEPRAISMQEILSSGNYVQHHKLKEPTTQDLVRIYEKWCSYVDKLFDKVEIHADAYTIDEIRNLLCEFGRNDVDVLLEGK